MSTPSQDNLFATGCMIAQCGHQATKGGVMCDAHFAKVPDALKYRLALTRQDVQRAKSDAARQDAMRKFDVARQACVQAVSK